jgi:hypothetical protein
VCDECEGLYDECKGLPSARTWGRILGCFVDLLLSYVLKECNVVSHELGVQGSILELGVQGSML